MSDKIVVPNGMLEVAKAAYDKNWRENGAVITNKILEAALRWLSDALGTSSFRLIVDNVYAARKDRGKFPCDDAYCIAVESVRRMFLAPETEVPEEIKSLMFPVAQGIPVALADNTVTVKKEVNDRIIEAYRRGKEAKEEKIYCNCSKCDSGYMYSEPLSTSEYMYNKPGYCACGQKEDEHYSSCGCRSAQCRNVDFYRGKGSAK